MQRMRRMLIRVMTRRTGAELVGRASFSLQDTDVIVRRKMGAMRGSIIRRVRIRRVSFLFALFPRPYQRFKPQSVDHESMNSPI